MRLHHLALVIVINLIWGLNFIAIKYAVAELPPLLINACRFFIVLLALFPFLKFIKGKMRDILRIAIVLGVLHFGLGIIAIALSEGVSEVAIVSQLNVPFATLMAVFFLREKIHLPRIIGISVSFLGVMYMGFDPIIFQHLDSFFTIVLATVVMAYSTILMRKLKEVPALTIQAWVGLAGFIGSLFLSLAFETGQVAALENISSMAIFALVFSAIGSSVIGHGGLNYLLRYYEVTVVSPYMLLMPVFGILGGVFILDESLTTKMIIGGILTFAGVGIITMRNIKKKPANPICHEDL